MRKKNIFKLLTVATAMLLLVGCKDVQKVADKKESQTELFKKIAEAEEKRMEKFFGEFRS